MPWDVSLFKKNVCMFYSKKTSKILEVDEQHKRKIKVDSQITIAQTVNSIHLKDRILMHKHSVFQILFLYMVSVRYYFQKVSFCPLDKETL